MLMLECFGRSKPAFELVRVIAGKIVNDHVGLADIGAGASPPASLGAAGRARKGAGELTSEPDSG